MLCREEPGAQLDAGPGWTASCPERWAQFFSRHVSWRSKSIGPIGEQLQTVACFQIARKAYWFNFHSQGF